MEKNEIPSDNSEERGERAETIKSDF